MAAHQEEVIVAANLFKAQEAGNNFRDLAFERSGRRGRDFVAQNVRGFRWSKGGVVDLPVGRNRKRIDANKR